MSNTDIDIDYIASLARLEIAPEEREKLSAELKNIVNYIAELSEVDVDGVEPTAHAIALSNVWREDEAVESADRTLLFENAPALMNGDLFKVPQTLPGEGIN